MTQFEFIVTGVSIVLALGVARLLEGLRDSFDPSRRYWIHSLWVVTKLMSAAVFFWGAWQTRGVSDRNFVEFLAILAVPSILFLQAHTLMTAHPDSVPDWRGHFWTIRRWFFVSNTFYVLFSFNLVRMEGGAPLSSPQYIPMTIVLLLSIVGAVSSNERVHGVIGIVAFVNMFGAFGALTYLAR